MYPMMYRGFKIVQFFNTGLLHIEDFDDYDVFGYEHLDDVKDYIDNYIQKWGED
jgi:hypothetical protein